MPPDEQQSPLFLDTPQISTEIVDPNNPTPPQEKPYNPFRTYRSNRSRAALIPEDVQTAANRPLLEILAPPKQPKHNKNYNLPRYTKMREQFLIALSETGIVSRAAEIANAPVGYLYHWRAVDETFAKNWEEAKNIAIEALEDEAYRRAKEGIQNPVFYKGEIAGYNRQFSDVLAMFLLKGAKPDKYRERTEHTGPNGGPISIILSPAESKF